MTGLANRFLVFSVLFLTLGMIWGIQMGASHDHTLSPAHAHLNLVGGVLFAVFAFFYHLVPRAAVSRTAQAHFWIALAGVCVLIPGIAMTHSGGSETLAIIGSFISLLSMLVFAFAVISHRG